MSTIQVNSMSDALLIFGGRSEKERAIFGGEVTVSLDGKVIGTLQDEDIEIRVSEAAHTIRMSKSHEYGSQIGHATETLEVKAGDKLLIKYTPPLLVNAPGTILVSDYDGRNLEQRLLDGQDAPIAASIAKSEEKKALERQRSSNYNAILIVTLIVIGIISIISVVSISNASRSL